ncbi:MAG: XTP/dITP diphosphatase [Firmicutes bacterium]|jgi:XTP/dITP diphosphohydrolase|nr:XTP/dITP diphosphatase [Bacillota bacterium]NLL89052.1 XTP/dITP diphosphatase [Bacillota bacterium]HKM17009.1 XTP/dITP diphosphatase [Limnochordia bacterium]
MPKPVLVVASQNLHKVGEIKVILSDLPLVVKGADEAGLPQVIEDGATFEDNAVKKALTAAKALGCMALADDSGLMVDWLNGEPGVHSARYAGSPTNDQLNNEKLLSKLGGVPWEKRDARFVCVIALATPEGEVITYTGTCPGKIAFEPRGNNGFGYDPLFVVPELSQTFAELDPEVKNRISHRAKALAQLRQGLREKFA